MKKCNRKLNKSFFQGELSDEQFAAVINEHTKCMSPQCDDAYLAKQALALNKVKPLIDKTVRTAPCNYAAFVAYWGLDSIATGFGYDKVNKNNDLTLGAAIWILDALKASGKLEAAYQYLPKKPIDISSLRIPKAKDCVHSDELLAAMVYTIQNRHNTGNIKTKRCIMDDYNVKHIDNDAVAKAKANYEAILGLIPKENKDHAIAQFRTNYFELIKFGAICVKHYRTELEYRMTQPSPSFPYFDTGVDAYKSDSCVFAPSLHPFREEVGEALAHFNAYLAHMYTAVPMVNNAIPDGIKEIDEKLSLNDPFEYSFLVFYLADLGDDLLWTHGPALSMAQRAVKALPWISVNGNNTFKHEIFKKSGVIPPRVSENDTISVLMEQNPDGVAILLKKVVNQSKYVPVAEEVTDSEAEKVKMELVAYNNVLAEFSKVKAINKALRKEVHDQSVKIDNLVGQNIEANKKIKELNTKLNAATIVGNKTYNDRVEPQKTVEETHTAVKPTLVFGGGSKWVAGMRALVNGDVKFVAMNLEAAKEALANASVVWINLNNTNANNAKALAKAAKKLGVPTNYFKSNSFQSCMNEMISA